MCGFYIHGRTFKWAHNGRFEHWSKPFKVNSHNAMPLGLDRTIVRSIRNLKLVQGLKDGDEIPEKVLDKTFEKQEATESWDWGLAPWDGSFHFQRHNSPGGDVYAPGQMINVSSMASIGASMATGVFSIPVSMTTPSPKSTPWMFPNHPVAKKVLAQQRAQGPQKAFGQAQISPGILGIPPRFLGSPHVSTDERDMPFDVKDLDQFMPAEQLALINWCDTHWGKNGDEDEFLAECIRCLDYKKLRPDLPRTRFVKPMTEIAKGEHLRKALLAGNEPKERFAEMFVQGPNEYWAAKV